MCRTAEMTPGTYHQFSNVYMTGATPSHMMPSYKADIALLQRLCCPTFPEASIMNPTVHMVQEHWLLAAATAHDLIKDRRKQNGETQQRLVLLHHPFVVECQSVSTPCSPVTNKVNQHVTIASAVAGIMLILPPQGSIVH